MASSFLVTGAAAAIFLATSVSAAQSAAPALTPAPAIFPATKHRNPTLMVAGIVVSAVGVSALAVGGIGLKVGCSAGSCSEDGGFAFPAIGLLAGGLLHVLVGVPILIAGAVPPRDRTAPSASWAMPSLAGGPGSTGLCWTF